MNGVPLIVDILLARCRARFLALRGATVGSKVSVAGGCVFTRPSGISLGPRVSLERDVYFKVVARDALVSIGALAFIGRGVEFDAMLAITVGAHAQIAPHCFITDHAHGIAPSLRIDQQPCASAAVHIGADVWLGYGVVVLPGVTIGDGAVVGANSVVAADVQPLTVVAGSPARKIRDR